MKPLHYHNAYRLQNLEGKSDNFKQWYVRALGIYGESGFGVFQFDLHESQGGNRLVVIATIEEDWDHVSVSMQERCPTWEEMDFIYRKFFWSSEVCVQYHLSGEKKVNMHGYCLHIWRPNNKTIQLPQPPIEMV